MMTLWKRLPRRQLWNAAPISDVQSSAEYRKEMIEVFTGRAIQEALKVAEAL